MYSNKLSLHVYLILIDSNILPAIYSIQILTSGSNLTQCSPEVKLLFLNKSHYLSCSFWYSCHELKIIIENMQFQSDSLKTTSSFTLCLFSRNTMNESESKKTGFWNFMHSFYCLCIFIHQNDNGPPLSKTIE